MIDTEQFQTMISMGAVRGFTRYLIYDVASGRIVKYGQARDTLEDGGASMVAQADVGQEALAITAFPDINLTYCPGGVLTPRPVMPIAASVSGRVITLTGIPVGAAYRVEGEAVASGNATESIMVFTFGTGGMFRLSLASFPFQDWAQSFTLA